MELRKYQQDIVNDLEGHLAFDNLAVIPLPGGGGKSAIIAELARIAHNEKKNCVVLTNLTALVPQLARHLDEFNVPYSVVKAGSHSLIEEAYITLIMEQSFHEKKRKELNVQCDILIKDEMHIGIGQKRYEDIVKHLEPTKIIGTTFTPIDEKGYLMGNVSPEQIVNTINVDGLVEQGFLAPIKYFVPKWSEEIDYSEIASSGNDYNGKEIDKIVNTDEHNSMVIASMNKMKAKTKKTLVYASSIEHANNLKIALEHDGYTVGIVHSKMPSESNLETIKLFKDEEVRTEPTLENPTGDIKQPIGCIVSVMGLTVGFDAPAAKLLVNLRATKVLRLYLQMIARISRPYPGKEYGEVLDLAQCSKLHGFLDEPISYIKKGNKHELDAAKEKRASNVIPLIVGDEPTEVNRELVLKKVEELERKKKQIPELQMHDLIAIYETSEYPIEILRIAHEINMRKTGKSYTRSNVEFISLEWDAMIEKFPQYKTRLLKTLRTMSKNKVSQGKKLAALHYSPAWLMEQTPYCLYVEPDSVDVSKEVYNAYNELNEGDIPF